MAAAGLDALVAISPENFAWKAGFVVPSQPLMRWRHAMCVTAADGARSVVCVDMEESTVRGRLPDDDIRVWGEFTDDPMATLAALLTDLGAAKGRIGIEFGYLPAGDCERLRALLPGARLEPADDLFDRLRQIKPIQDRDEFRQQPVRRAAAARAGCIQRKEPLVFRHARQEHLPGQVEVFGVKGPQHGDGALHEKRHLIEEAMADHLGCEPPALLLGEALDERFDVPAPRTVIEQHAVTREHL